MFFLILSVMVKHMSLHIGITSKSLSARIAFVNIVADVGLHVLCEIAFVSIRFVTNLAYERCIKNENKFESTLRGSENSMHKNIAY